MSTQFKQPGGRPKFPVAGYYGLLGEIVQHAAPQSEGDPCGSLAGAISYTSAMLGRSVATRIKATEHPFGLSTLLIGSSGNGKKGSAVDAIMPHLWAADPGFMKACRLGAVASGEGLIAAVADPSKEQQMLGLMLGVAPWKGGEDELPPWRGGRRVIFHDSEFSTGTMVALSCGTTAAVMRKCFDGDDLSNSTKKESHFATRPHVVFHGHTTPQSFAHRVSGVHAEGGTYNRFLVFYVHRSKVDPNPDIPASWERKAKRLGERLGAVISAARVGWEEGLTQYVSMDASAKKVWRDYLYAELSVVDEGQMEIVQQFTTRAAPICIRLAGLYAAIDGRLQSSAADLEAAAICVRYSMASVLHTSMEFAAAAGGETPKERQHRLDLKMELTERGTLGMSRWDVTAFFGRNLSATVIDAILVRLGAKFILRQSEDSRRPSRLYFLPEFAPVSAEDVA